jgi:hypothetical protein
MKTIKHITSKQKKQKPSQKARYIFGKVKSSKKSITNTNMMKLGHKHDPRENQKRKIVMVEKTKVEYLLLFNTLFNYYILLVSHNYSNNERKIRLEELILQMRYNNKLVSSDTSNIQIKNIVNYLDTFFHQLLLLINQSLKSYKHKSHKSNKNHKNHKNTKNHNDKKQSHKGGFYFKSLEEKGDTPITGADLTRLLDEMQQFFYNAKYTEEGKFLQDTDTLVSMLRGDVNQFKSILQYRIFPQFYSVYPPFIKWDAIYDEIITKRRWEDLPDYLLAYQSYLRSRDEYLVEKGLKPPSVLQKDLYTGFYNKMANSINDNIYAFQNARNKFQGKFFPITLPP